jgi:SAM-dependent methyltransferase
MWRIWDLDIELRYRPVVEGLPPSTAGVVCEIGSGPRGLSAWSSRPIVAIDPDLAERARETPDHVKVVASSGTAIPLPDRSVAAAVAVDMLEHVPRDDRPAVVAEMKRITADGGRLILMGPVGPAAAEGDRRLSCLLSREGMQGGNTARWIGEHIENGLPTREELLSLVGTDRVRTVRLRSVLPMWVWWAMHLAGMGLLPRSGPLHPIVWAPVACWGRRVARGPCYRTLLVADLAPSRW